MGKRKITVACAAFFALAAGLRAMEFEASARLRPALFSSYSEQAGPDFSGDPQRIWGDFGSYYADAEFGAGVLDWLWLRVGGKGGLIAPNPMYLGAEENSLTIGGCVYGFDAGPAFRLSPGESADIDLGVAFSYTHGVKTFTEYVQAGTIVMPGPDPFGSYAFTMFGPNAYVRGRYRFPGPIALALSAEAFGSPYFENHSLVGGWSDGPKHEFASGYRYGGRVAAEWIVAPSIGVELGWQAERMRYAAGQFATHDLDILFSGPFAGASFRF